MRTLSCASPEAVRLFGRLWSYVPPDTHLQVGVCTRRALVDGGVLLHLALFGRTERTLILAPLVPQWDHTQEVEVMTVLDPLPSLSLLLTLPRFLAFSRQRLVEAEQETAFLQVERLCFPTQARHITVAALLSGDLSALLRVLPLAGDVDGGRGPVLQVHPGLFV